MTSKHWPIALPVAGLLFLTGCGLVPHGKARVTVADSITVTSPAFRDGGLIPTRFACTAYQGQGKTPPLRWSVPASGIGAFAVVVDDPDATDGTFVHWILFNLGSATAELLEGAVPQHALQAMNTAQEKKYAPPCPPKGERHRYRFTVYALNEPVPLGDGAGLRDALSAIAARTIARGRLTARFGGQ